MRTKKIQALKIFEWNKICRFTFGKKMLDQTSDVS